jgi:chromosome segregation ATPase
MTQEHDQFFEQEQFVNGEESISSDDLIFMIGEKEADLFRKRKAIASLFEKITQLQSQNKNLSEEKTATLVEFEALKLKLNQKKDMDTQNQEEIASLEKQFLEKEQTSRQEFEREKRQLMYDMEKTCQEKLKQQKETLDEQYETSIKKITKKLEKQRDLTTSLREKLEDTQ